MMANGMVRCTLNAVLDDVNLKDIDTSRVQCLRELAKSVLKNVPAGKRELVAFFGRLLGGTVLFRPYRAITNTNMDLIPREDKCSV